MALKTMPIGKLQQLKSQVEAAISAKVTERRRELEFELSKLAGFGGRGKAVKFASGGRMGPVAPKYRNPEKTRRRPGLAVASSRAGWLPPSKAARNWTTF
jgi:hypothetical protein